MPGNGHVRLGPEAAGKGPASGGHLADGLPEHPAPRASQPAEHSGQSKGNWPIAADTLAEAASKVWSAHMLISPDSV
ncbi:MAG: hypothetical protein ACRDNF_14535, partial [Streptosporangiaceae bacterium]